MTQYPDVWKALVNDPERLDPFMSESKPALDRIGNGTAEHGPVISPGCLAILKGSKIKDRSLKLTKEVVGEFSLLTPV